MSLEFVERRRIPRDTACRWPAEWPVGLVSFHGTCALTMPNLCWPSPEPGRSAGTCELALPKAGP